MAWASLAAQWVKNRLAMQETQEMLGLSLAWEGPLEAGTATHSSIRAWRILWTQEPGKLQSMGGLKESDTTEVTEHAHDRWLNFQWLKQTGILFSFVIGNLDIVLLALIWKSELYQQLPVLLAPPGCLSPLSHKRAPEVLESRSSLLSRKKGWEEDQYQAHWFLFSFT